MRKKLSTKKGKIDIAVAILNHPKSNPPRCLAGGFLQQKSVHRFDGQSLCPGHKNLSIGLMVKNLCTMHRNLSIGLMVKNLCTMHNRTKEKYL